jgi:hypothetical protein
MIEALKKSITDEESCLKEIELHKNDVAKKIDCLFAEASSKIIKDRTPVSSVRRSTNWLDYMKKDQNIVWPADSSY